MGLPRFLLLLLLVAVAAAQNPLTTSATCKSCATTGQCATAYNGSTGKFCGLVQTLEQYCCCAPAHACPLPGAATCDCFGAADAAAPFTKTRQVLVLVFLGFALFGCVVLCERLGLPAGRRQGYINIESAHYPG
ncbi:hypothetical protein ACHHYP_04558 [Achlya hypogyna]|uniref:Secreted protein n=1 Tax=Achlya hypogyna TaxID=1202772 RepID=A0A1V9Z0W0_ACHHY|nr:hypothetical protein ACHHYP_04558 [Achlya hypogyna]